MARLFCLFATVEGGLAPWTQVLLGNGSQAAIGSLRPGDIVASWDDEQRQTEAAVLRVETAPAESLLEMRALVFTAEQPFRGEKGAVALEPEEGYVTRMRGEELLESCDGGRVEAEVREYGAPTRVVTLELGGPHWFCAEGLVVHNNKQAFHHSFGSRRRRSSESGGGSGGYEWHCSGRECPGWVTPAVLLLFLGGMLGTVVGIAKCKTAFLARKEQERRAMVTCNGRGLTDMRLEGRFRGSHPCRYCLVADRHGGISGICKESDGSVANVEGSMKLALESSGEIAWREWWTDGDGPVEVKGTILCIGGLSITARVFSREGEIGTLGLKEMEDKFAETFTEPPQGRREAMTPKNGINLGTTSWAGLQHGKDGSHTVKYEWTVDAAGVIKGRTTTTSVKATVDGAITWPEGASGGQIAWREECGSVHWEVWGSIFCVGPNLKVSASFCSSSGRSGQISLHEAGAEDVELEGDNGRGLTSTSWAGEYRRRNGESKECKYEWIVDAQGKIKGSVQGCGSTAQLTGSLNWPATAETGEIAWREQWVAGHVAAVRGSISGELAQLTISAAQFPSWAEECQLTLRLLPPESVPPASVPPASREGTLVHERLPLLRA